MLNQPRSVYSSGREPKASTLDAYPAPHSSNCTLPQSSAAQKAVSKDLTALPKLKILRHHIGRVTGGV